MQERHARARTPQRGWTRRQRALVIFWGTLALVIALGLPRILAHPDHPTHTPTGAVIINEFGTAGSGPTDEHGDTPDWIELHNRTLTPVHLQDWRITDDPSQTDKWIIGDVTIAPDAYMIVFASGQDQDEFDEDELFLHTNFRLDSAGGYLALLPPTARQFIDGTIFEYPAQSPHMSYALVQNDRGAWSPRYLTHPTPGAANDTSQTWAGIVPAVEVDQPHGIYDAPITVTLSNVIADAEIIYTTDGSTPSASHGTAYTQPLTLRATTPLRAVALLPDYAPSPVATHTYIFIDSVVNQNATPPGWPTTWGTHSISRGPYLAGSDVQADYAMDSRITDDPIYRHQLIDGLHEIPTLSLVTDITNLDIYATPQDRGRDFERPVSIEWIDPTGTAASFQVNAGIRIQGNAGRLEYMPKHSFRLFFRQEYGAAKLNYPLFADSHITEFETLVLRGGVNWGFAGDYADESGRLDQRERATYLRDEWTRASQIAISDAGSHGRFVHLYLNGLYWGLYNIVERPDAAFAASYFGGDESEWSAINHGGFVSGAPDRFSVMLDLARNNNLVDPAAYATFTEFIDPAQFSDYIILNWYAGNHDWPETNWYVTVQNPAGRNLFWVWDAEATWIDGAWTELGGATEEGAPHPNVTKLIFEAAWANPDFRLVFADRLYRHLYHDGALTDLAATERWHALQVTLNNAIVAESARWGDVRYDAPITHEDWQHANANVLWQMDGNAAKLIELARTAGYYPPIDPPQMSPRGSEFDATQTVTLAAPTGTIYYTTDGSDPRTLATGEPSPSAQIYTAPVTLTTTSVLKARLLVALGEGGVWSALESATFAKRDEAAHVVISEIMYNPAVEANDEDFEKYEDMEFIELTNAGNTAADLSGAYFEGIDFRFDDGASLHPGEHLVLIRSLRNFRERYPEAPIYGQYEGKLSDKGETITLRRANGTIWWQVTYDDNYGWPLSADGAGDSLVLIDPAGDLNSAHNWRASTTLYGTPGTGEAE